MGPPQEPTVRVEEVVPAGKEAVPAQGPHGMGVAMDQPEICEDVVEPEQLPQTTAKQSTEERLAELQTRQHHVALLSDIAEKMLDQGRSDQSEVIEHNDSWKEMEERKFKAMLQEGKCNRQAMQESIQMNATIMKSAVDALNHLGNILTGMQGTPVSTPRSQNTRKRVAKVSGTPGRNSHGSEHGISKGYVIGDKDTTSSSQSLLSTVTPSMPQSGDDCRSSKHARAPKNFFFFDD
ncbi:UNVERIFIED_CONTAM: hypothetical protein K2H54_056975 [Gekko kuhli]